MFNKKKKVQDAFNEIDTYLDKSTLKDDEKRHLKGLLRNIKIRAGVS